MMTDLLSVEGLHAGYGDLPVLRGIDLKVGEGEVVSVVGANGAGKTTLLRTLAGLLPAKAGRIGLGDQDLTGMRADHVVGTGLVLVPEGRCLFPFLTVSENLRLGAYHPGARNRYKETLEEVLELFPVLHDRGNQYAGSLSGGEQQMCALARGLMARPRVLMLDEPSLGLAPIIVEQVFELIRKLSDGGLTILLVEQNVAEALDLSSRAYVIEQGRITFSGSSGEILADERLRSAYMGAE